MPIKLDAFNIFHLISALAPFMVSFLLVMISLFNQNLKGLVYLAGVLLATIINLIIMNTLGPIIGSYAEKNSQASVLCELVEIPFLKLYNIPSPASVFLGFTFMYLLLPMIMSGQTNIGVVVFLLMLMVIDAVSKVSNKCTTTPGVVFGTLFGGLLGTLWFTLFKESGHESLLYYNELQSNNVQCSRPSKQTFKCSVYKNGEIISSSIA